MRVPPGRLGVVVALLACGAVTALAQTTVIENATILTGDGTTIEKGSIVIRGEEIDQVGREVRAGGGIFSRPTKIDASGKYVTPGLIDVWSSPVGGLPSVGRPIGRALDTYDPFDEDLLRAAHRAGVTTLYVPARTQGGFGGLGAVVRLIPGGKPEQYVVDGRAALCGALGGRGLALARNHAGLDAAFREAREYREQLETYEEDLEQYEKDLKEWLEKREKEKKEKGDDKKDEKGGKSDDAGKKGDGKQDEAEKSDGEGGTASAEPRPRRRRRPGGPARKPAVKKDGGDDKDKDDDAPKKPTPPPRDPDKDVLLEALDGELVWRVEADAVADIRTALELAETYHLALVIEDARGAAWLAKDLAEQDVPVVVGTAEVPIRGGAREVPDDAIHTLNEAGVRVFFGSGRTDATPQLPLRAAQAVAAGMDADEALNRLMHDAAELLGVSERVGRLGRGMAADVVIWSAHPFAPDARVERVFVDGKEVYVADQ